jgi:hypothetical protein
MALAGKILERVYKRSAIWLMNKYDLVHARDIPTLGNFEHTEKGLAYAVNREYELVDKSRALVVGGSCLGYCEGRIEQLGLEVVADILYPLYLSRLLKTECLLYITVTEEAMVSRDSVPYRFWTFLGDIIERFVVDLARIFEPKNLHIFRTDIPHVNLAIEAAVHLHINNLASNLISSLYAVDSSGRDSNKDAIRLAQYRRNIVGYIPGVIRTAIGIPSTHIIAAENIHQVKAIKMARSILDSESSLGSDIDRIDHVVYLSPPSITGTNRMSRASSKSAIYILEGIDEIERKLNKMSATSKYYWNSVWPEILLLNLLGERDFLLLDLIAEIQRLFKYCIARAELNHKAP